MLVCTPAMYRAIRNHETRISNRLARRQMIHSFVGGLEKFFRLVFGREARDSRQSESRPISARPRRMSSPWTPVLAVLESPPLGDNKASPIAPL
jgi:hypothetical protein